MADESDFDWTQAYTVAYAPVVHYSYARGVLAGVGYQDRKVVNHRCLYCRSTHQANKCPNCGGNEYE